MPPSVDPEIVERRNAADEANAAVRWLIDRHRSGLAWRQMVVLAPGKRNWRGPIAKALDGDAIPYRMLLGDKSIGPDFVDDHVHVMTLHAVEGLAFSAVAVLGIGDLPWKSQTLEEAMGLLDGALSRATDASMVSYSKPSVLIERLLSPTR